MESSRTCGLHNPDRGAPDRRYPRFRPGDVVLVAAALSVAAFVAFRHEGGSPRALAAGCPSGEVSLPLPSDTVLMLAGRLGPVRIEVAGREARVACSPCPGQQCVEAGWISSPGEVSVCAPSGVWIRIEGDGEAPDAVSY